MHLILSKLEPKLILHFSFASAPSHQLQSILTVCRCVPLLLCHFLISNYVAFSG